MDICTHHNCLCWLSDQLPHINSPASLPNNRVITLLNAKVHGTVFGTLHLMSKMEGKEKNGLVPFGRLAAKGIPCFAGANDQGIRDTGVNQLGTSWAHISDVNDIIQKYAKASFDIEFTKKAVQGFIDAYRVWNKGETTGFPIQVGSTAYWNGKILLIRQLKSWDPEEFQKQFAPGLLEWLNASITCLERSCYTRRGTLIKENQEYFAADIAKMRDLITEIQATPVFQLTTADQAIVSDSIPIVLLSTEVLESDRIHDSEYAVSRIMRLGHEILYIATERSKITTIEAHLKNQELADRVTVISFNELRCIASVLG